MIAIITSINALVVTTLSVAHEQGTLDQLLISPLTPGMIMMGKIIPAILVAVVQRTIILLVLTHQLCSIVERTDRNLSGKKSSARALFNFHKRHKKHCF